MEALTKRGLCLSTRNKKEGVGDHLLKLGVGAKPDLMASTIALIMVSISAITLVTIFQKKHP